MGIEDKQLPNSNGYFGQFGARFVPETLIPALDELASAYEEALVEVLDER